MANYYSDSDVDPCELECVVNPYHANARVVNEYQGPVKLTLVDVEDLGFWPRVCGAALITLALLYMGCVVATVVFFSLSFQLPPAVNFHIGACMIGFQLLIPHGILMWNPVFAPTSFMLPGTKLQQHMILQTSAYTFICIGSLHVLSAVDSIPGNAHALTGILAFLGATAASTLGTLYRCFFAKVFKFPHAVLGLITYIVSSISACLAIMSRPFRAWCTKGLIPEIPIILVLLCAMQTVLILMSVKCRLREKN